MGIQTNIPGIPIDEAAFSAGGVMFGDSAGVPTSNPSSFFWDNVNREFQVNNGTAFIHTNLSNAANPFVTLSDGTNRSTIEVLSHNLRIGPYDAGGDLILTTDAGTIRERIFHSSGDAIYYGNYKIKGPVPWADVRAFGAVGDGVTDDTAAIQAAVNSGATTIYFPFGTYLISSTISGFTGAAILTGPGGITQNAAGFNLFDVTGCTGLTIRDMYFVGVGGNFSQSSNSAIYATSGTYLKIINTRFKGFRWHAIFLTNVSDIEIGGCIVTGGNSGIILYGCKNFSIHHNFFTTPEYTGLNTVIYLNTTQDFATLCTDGTIDHNIFNTYTNAQVMLLHGGSRINIDSNVMDNVYAGIVLSPLQAGDTLQDVNITNNIYNGTSTAGGSIGNFGINVGGGNTFRSSRITVQGNRLFNANFIDASSARGGIGIGFADDVSVIENIIQTVVSAGLVIGNNCSRFLFRGNCIYDVAAASDTTQTGIEHATGTAATGIIEENRINGSKQGIRFDAGASVGIIVRRNRFESLTGAKVINPASVTFQDPLNLPGTATITGAATSAAVSFGQAEADANYAVSVICTNLGGAATPTVYVTGKSTSGFTINVVAAPGGILVYTFDWFIERE